MNIFSTIKKIFTTEKSYTEIVYPNPSTDTHWYDKKKEFDNDTITGGCIIVGDSITEGFLSSYPTFFSNSFRNYGIAGDTSIGVTRRLDSILKAKPDKVIFAIGTNDLGAQMIPSKNNGYVIENYNDINKVIESIIFNYNAMIQILSVSNPSVQIFISSILPINNTFDFTTTITSDMDTLLQTDIKSVQPLLKKRNNNDIIITNTKLFQLSHTFSNVTFIDMFSKLFDFQSQQMNPTMVFDGLHLNINGYTIWKNELEKIL